MAGIGKTSGNLSKQFEWVIINECQFGATRCFDKCPGITFIIKLRYLNPLVHSEVKAFIYISKYIS